MLTAATNRVSDWKWECISLLYNNNVETDTGFDLPLNGEIDHKSMCVYVQTVDATETIDVGLLYSENTNGGDANGFLAALSIATAGYVFPSLAVTQGASNAPYVTTDTYGAYFNNGFAGSAGTGVTNVGVPVLRNHFGDGSQKSISYTCSSGSDTFVGFLLFRWRQWPNLANFLK